ncbi:hypothetical protein AVEN_98048-1 [Araneus ventricosus]|uniref:Uncharacterized protein n=1 Tax=Araneus ventricosus TaxID=182803 RepID=A0A4Y2QYL5_ARAVE|nr:hypothetical protein AVEN_98048-1 [Araneus ventricosus]
MSGEEEEGFSAPICESLLYYWKYFIDGSASFNFGPVFLPYDYHFFLRRLFKRDFGMSTWGYESPVSASESAASLLTYPTWALIHVRLMFGISLYRRNLYR